MYKEFFHLKENPFNVTADPQFFFSSSRHTEAFSHLLYGIRQRKGILVITGEVGTGKTTLCRTLLNRLDENIKTALILNPNFSATQLLHLIIHDLGIEGTFRNKFALVNALNTFLIQETGQGHNVALIIDEAQNLRTQQLEQIRLLSNLETEKEKLLQIILVGQPELCEKLKLASIRQLNQRISVRYHINPLDKEESREYIKHRFKCANASPENNDHVPFTDEAFDLIYESSGGIPRKINILCDRALLAGYTQGTRRIDEKIVQSSLEEVFA